MSEPTPNLGRGMAKGISVTLSSYLFSRLVNFVTTVALARILAPSEMGIVATALLIVYFVDVVRDFGLRDAVVFQGAERSDIQATAFYLIAFLSLAQMLAMLGLALFFWHMQERLDLAAVLGVMALFFPLQALGAVQEANLQRSLRFGELAFVEIAGVIVKAAVTYLTLVIGFGAVSFAIGQLAGSGLRTALLWLCPDVSGFIRSRFHRSMVGSLVGYGKHIFMTGLVHLARTRSDQAAIALLIGDVALAGYFLATRLPEILISGVSTALTRVIFPSFVEASRSDQGLAPIFLSVMHGCMTLIAPIAIGLAAISGKLMPLVFGGAYQDAATAMSYLALVGIPLTLGWSVGDVLKATGRPGLLTKISFLQTCVLVPLVWIACQASHDLGSVAAALLGAECISAIIWLSLVPRLVGVSAAQVLRSVSMPLLAAVLMGGIVLIVQSLLTSSDLVAVTGSIVAGVVAYSAIIALIDPESVRKLRMLLG